MTDIATSEPHFDSDTSPAIQASFPKVVATVINFNGRDVTLQTLSSLDRLRYPHLQLAVVDNGSTDGSSEAIAKHYPEVDIVRCEVNEGIAPGINRGIRHALSSSGDYILLLDNDVEVDPAMVAELVDVAESSPMIGCVGPKSYYYHDRERLWSAGGILRFGESVTAERGRGELDVGQYDRVEDVDYVSGCAVLIKRTVLERVGLFDPVYSVGVENADWCVRAKRLGYRCCYAPHAVLWLMVSQTVGLHTPGETYQSGRGSAIFARRYADGRQWVSFWLAVLATLPLAYVRGLLAGNEEAAQAKWRGIADGLRVRLEEPPRL